MTDYQVLSQDEQDDTIVAFMLSQERDKFCHELNLQRYKNILNKAKKSEWASRIAGLHADTLKRLAEIDSIIEATRPQMPLAKRLEAAKQRLLERANRG